MQAQAAKMTPEYAEVLAKRAGCAVRREFERGVEWVVMTGPAAKESVATWRLLQMSERDFCDWHLNRAKQAA